MKKEWKGGLDNRSEWDTIFMAQAYLISQRSIDPRTVHGACLVSKDNRILSVGYNGLIRNSKDSSVAPLLDSDLKYKLIIHAEDNCIMNYHGSNSDLEGATIYVTGEPCHRCLRTILQKGIKRIVYGNVGSKCVDVEDQDAKNKMLESLDYGVDIVKYNKVNDVKELLEKTLQYIEYKEKS